MQQSNTFPKSEHLCGAKNLTRLFSEGEAFIIYPLRVIYLWEPFCAEFPPVRVVVTVPKRRFKRAVDRNRLKRLMREAYRLNKSDVCSVLQERSKQLLLAFHYVSDEKLDFSLVERKMKLALRRIIESLEASDN